jgi:hypothetical protein
VAFADITSNPERKKDNSLFEEKNEIGKRLKNQDDKVVSINIQSLPKSISKEEIKNTKGLENFKAGRPETNIRLEDFEYELIKGLSK